MVLIIFAGASDPYMYLKTKNVYVLKKAYQDLYDYARELGYTSIILPSYNGHSSKKSSNLLTIETTIQTMQDIVNKLEKQQQIYEVLAISYGTFAFIELLNMQKFDYLKRVIMWGAGSCDSYYKNMITKEQENTRRLLDNGTKIKEDIFYNIKPFVVSVFELSNVHLKFDVIICGGTKDEFYSESLRQSLLKVNKNKHIILPCRVENCGHSIDISNDACLNVVFGENNERK